MSLVIFCAIVDRYSAAFSSADFGGNRGWGLSFADANQYAGVAGNFEPARFWPTTSITGGINEFLSSLVINNRLVSERLAALHWDQ